MTVIKAGGAGPQDKNKRNWVDKATVLLRLVKPIVEIGKDLGLFRTAAARVR